MKTITTRRALMKAAPMVAAIATAPNACAAVSSASVTTAGRLRWDKAMRAYESAVAEDTAFNRVFEDLRQRFVAETSAIPHTTFRRNPFLPNAEPTDTSNVMSVRIARDHIERTASETVPESDMLRYDYHRYCCEVVEAADRRDRAHDAIAARLNYDAMEQRWNDLGDQVCDARWALLTMPAPDLAALRWKLEYVLEDDGHGGCYSWTSDRLVQTRLDIARLMGGEA